MKPTGEEIERAEYALKAIAAISDVNTIGVTEWGNVAGQAVPINFKFNQPELAENIPLWTFVANRDYPESSLTPNEDFYNIGNPDKGEAAVSRFVASDFCLCQESTGKGWFWFDRGKIPDECRKVTIPCCDFLKNEFGAYYSADEYAGYGTYQPFRKIIDAPVVFDLDILNAWAIIKSQTPELIKEDTAEVRRIESPALSKGQIINICGFNPEDITPKRQTWQSEMMKDSRKVGPVIFIDLEKWFPFLVNCIRKGVSKPSSPEELKKYITSESAFLKK